MEVINARVLKYYIHNDSVPKIIKVESKKFSQLFYNDIYSWKVDINDRRIKLHETLGR